MNDNPSLSDMSPSLPDPIRSELAVQARLRSLTPARVGLRRTGDSLATAEILAFQLDHARARDAVHASLQPANLAASLRQLRWPSADSPVLTLHSQAMDRRTYLQRPDLGRRLDEPSTSRLASLATSGASTTACDLSIVIVDGLSALAVERHACSLLSELVLQLRNNWPTIRVAPLAIVEQGRVAVGDEVGMALGASLVVVLIGERPGLSSPDSLGAYITWNPRPGITDAQRNCISNIRSEGLSYKDAAARLVYYIHESHRLSETGVALKDPAGDNALSLAGASTSPSVSVPRASS
jgi:ethanolamine ammonia-lyase small subunit